MIIFSTMFYVNKELTKEKFMELALKWVNESPHYGFKSLIWNGEELFHEEAEKQKFSVILSNDAKIIAVRLENIDGDNVLWTNDFVLEEGDTKNILIVKLARSAVDKESSITRSYNRPRLMKTILKLGYGDKDNGLLISDKPLIIDENKLDLAEDIIKGNTNFLLPIIYVTKQFLDNISVVDVEELARDLAGTAHVLVEENTNITTELKKRTDGKNPFNGAVHIYYTDKIGTRIIPDEYSQSNAFRYKIANSVCGRLALVKTDEKYTWSTIKYQKLLEKYHKDQQESSELEQTYEDILKLKEQESSQLIEDMEIELNELRSKVQSYEYALQNKKSINVGNIVIECKEQEFFDSEIKDMILNVLEMEKKKMDADSNQVGWRKYHILSSILENNEIVGNGEKLTSELKEILSRIDRINAKDKKRLRELGFVLRHNKHNKIYFHNDDRYSITLGSTPSDSHASANSASIAINTIVCR